MNGTALPPAVILAGGLSRRMGRDKALVELGGKPLIAHVCDRILPQVSSLVVNAPDDFASPCALPLVSDDLAGHPGPLAGILAGLRDTAKRMPESTHLLSVPVDTPFLPADLAARLAAATSGQALIAVASSAGQLHPVAALWPLDIADEIENWLANPDNRRLQRFLAEHAMTTVEFPIAETPAGPLDPFFNVNSPDDLARAERFLEGAK